MNYTYEIKKDHKDRMIIIEKETRYFIDISGVMDQKKWAWLEVDHPLEQINFNVDESTESAKRILKWVDDNHEEFLL